MRDINNLLGYLTVTYNQQFLLSPLLHCLPKPFQPINSVPFWYEPCIAEFCLERLAVAGNKDSLLLWSECRRKWKISNCRELNPGLLAWHTSTLPLCYDDRTTTSPHSPLYVLLASLLSPHNGKLSSNKFDSFWQFVSLLCILIAPIWPLSCIQQQRMCLCQQVGGAKWEEPSGRSFLHQFTVPQLPLFSLDQLISCSARPEITNSFPFLWHPRAERWSVTSSSCMYQ